jgi:hypothetical protein
MEAGLKSTIDVAPSSHHKTAARISQTNFYQKPAAHHEERSFEGHIAFRNSFYNSGKYQDYVNVFGMGILDKLRNAHVPRQEDLGEAMRQKLQ